jgi:hypothetical protein
VTGAVSGDLVHLDIAYDRGFIQRFDGRLISRNTLVGSVIGEVAGKRTQGPDGVTYQRS